MLVHKLKRRRNLLISLGLVLVLVAAACGGDEDETPTAPQPTSTTPAGEPTPTTPAGEPTPTTPAVAPTPTSVPVVGEVPIPGGTLTMLGYDPDSYDTTAASYWEGGISKSFTHIKLTSYAFGGEDPLNSLDRTPHPDLAESWDISPDGLTVTFFLRQGVKWQNIPPVNGREVVASDVVFSYNRYIDPSNPNADILGSIVSVEAPDDYTVVFTFSDPAPAFLSNTAATWFPIEAPEVLDEFGSFETWESVIGAGPWMAVEYVVGARQVFERNPDYYRGPNGITGENLPYIDRVEVLLNVFEPAPALALYKDGILDVGPGYYYWGYWSAYPDTLAALEGADVILTGDFREFAESATAVHRLQPKVDQFPFNNQKIRQAVSLIINRSFGVWYEGAAIESRELSSAHAWFVPLDELGEGAIYYPVDADGNPTQNFELARQLLQEGLIEEGHDPTEQISVPIWIHRQEVIFEENASLFKADFAKIGIDLDIRVLEYTDYQDRIWAQGDYDGIAFGWAFGEYAADPSQYFVAHYVPGSYDNIAGINDPEVTALAEAAVIEIDPVVRQGIVEELQRILAVRQYEWQVPNWATQNLYPGWLKNVGPQKAAEAGNSFLEAWFTEDAPARD